MPTTLVDADGRPTHKVEDTPHATGDAGIMLLGVRNDTAAALAGANGDYAPLALDANGRLHVACRLYNGTTYDEQRGNVEGIALASAARTATTNGPDLTNHNGRGVVVWLAVSAVPTVDTLTLSIQGKDPAAGGYTTILAGTASAAAGTVVLEVGPGVASIANAKVGAQLPRTFRLVVAHSGVGSFTYSVGYSLQV